MNKPTRYNIYTDAQSNCFCEMEVHSEGEFVDWHEYKELQEQLEAVRGALYKAGQLALAERWDTRFPLIFKRMEAALNGEDK